MPQKIVHYVVAKELINKNVIKDEYKYIMGNIVPDSNDHTKKDHSLTHYITCENNKILIKFNDFFNKYKDKILDDDMYLGYYTHLLTDSLYRHYLYNIKKMKKYRQDENFEEKIYSDYNKLNRILIEKYNLEKIDIDIKIVPKEFKLHTLDKLQEEMDSYFDVICDNYNLHYLTTDLIYDFIQYCVDIIYDNIKNIRISNIQLLEEYSW